VIRAQLVKRYSRAGSGRGAGTWGRGAKGEGKSQGQSQGQSQGEGAGLRTLRKISEIFLEA
jgi:hypothetical protein